MPAAARTRVPSGIDAFAQEWGRLPPLYIHPPLPLVGRVLARLEETGAGAVLVVPRWVSAPWWPHLLRQSAGRRVRLGSTADALVRGSLFPPHTRLPEGQWIAVWVPPRDAGRAPTQAPDPR